MTLAITPRRWKLRTHRLSVDPIPSPIERLCRHEIWVGRYNLHCRNCGKSAK